jgi:hypothetical protein
MPPGKCNDVAVLADEFLPLVRKLPPDSLNVVFPDADCALPVEFLVKEAEVDARLERPVNLPDPIGGEKQDALRSLIVRLER